MQLKRMTVFGMLMVALTGWAFCPLAPAKSSGSTGDAPAVFFPEKAFEFPPVIDGVKVIHDFVVVNQGTAPLDVHNVRTG